MVKFRDHFGLWAAAALCAVAVLPGPAQTPPAAKAPVFSQPADSEIASPESGQNLPADNYSEETAQLFRTRPAPSLGSPTPDLNPAWQKRQQENSEWSLQTPEQIMGLQTPKQMFGLPEDDENLSPEERYLHRQDLAKASAAKSSLSQPDARTRDFSTRFDRADGMDSTPSPGEQDDAASFSRMFKDSGPTTFGNRKAPQSGSSPSAAAGAAESARAQKAQAAEMARFRSLIGEAPLTPTPEPALPHPQLETGLQSPTFSGLDEFGRPAASHLVDLSKPSGLTLPTEIVGDYTSAPRKPKKPSWEPQSPPWLSDNLSTPDKPPVRKFY